MDADNPVVKLCMQGMQAEIAGDKSGALALFMEAWDKQTDSYDACVAAHYVARHQASDDETLRWNLEALERAREAPLDKVRGFYPSLLLCVGKSYEDLGNPERAAEHYAEAEARLEDLPEGPYGDLIRTALEDAKARAR